MKAISDAHNDTARRHEQDIYGLMMIQLASSDASRTIFVTALSDVITVPDRLIARFISMLLPTEHRTCVLETDNNKVCCDRDELVSTVNIILNIRASTRPGSYPLCVEVRTSTVR